MGIKQDLNPVMKVVDKNGKILEEYTHNPGPRDCHERQVILFNKFCRMTAPERWYLEEDRC